jgi:hypothetical protein
VDDDGEKEIIAGIRRTTSPSYRGFIYVFNGKTFAQEWKSAEISGPTKLLIADSDNDNTKEIITITWQSGFFVFDGKTHIEEWNGQAGGVERYEYDIEVGDLDNDDTKEILTTYNPGDFE